MVLNRAKQRKTLCVPLQGKVRRETVISSAAAAGEKTENAGGGICIQVYCQAGGGACRRFFISI